MKLIRKIFNFFNKKTIKKTISESENIGYKVFYPDWTCRNFQFEIGKKYIHSGKIQLCGSGFHFCKKLLDCFSYYDFNPNNKVAIVKYSGETIHGDDKSVTKTIEIVRELSWQEVLDLVNIGKGNTGIKNTGHSNSGNNNSGNNNSGNWNSGNRNLGDFNSGNFNSGNSNSGDRNLGYKNSGNRNTGSSNTGNSNSGNYNSGCYNSGDWNTGNYNSGNGYLNYFCTEEKFFLFDKEVPKEILYKIHRIYPWGWFDLQNKSYHKAWQKCPEEILKYLKSLPEFQIDEAIEKFKIITGVDLNKI